MKADAYYRTPEGSIEDKLWFIEKVGLRGDDWVLADYGCGDGRIMAAAMGYPSGPCFAHGYDIEERAVQQAMGCFLPVYATSSLAGFEGYIRKARKDGYPTVLLLSSVLHEVLSVSGMTLGSFWNFVRALGCDYIAVRDMAIDADLYKTPVPASLWHRLVEHDGCRRVCEMDPKVKPLANMAQATQVLLKYPYQANLEREAGEDYLPMSAQAYLNHLTIGSGYELKHYEHYGVPALQRKWAEEVGVSMYHPTHFKALLRKVR